MVEYDQWTRDEHAREQQRRAELQAWTKAHTQSMTAGMEIPGVGPAVGAHAAPVSSQELPFD